MTEEENNQKPDGGDATGVDSLGEEEQMIFWDTLYTYHDLHSETKGFTDFYDDEEYKEYMIEMRQYNEAEIYKYM